MSRVDDIGKQVRELLPEYPHLWSRVITLIERLEQENAVLREALEFYSSGMHLLRESAKAPKGVNVCPEIGHYAREALEKARVLRERK